MGRPANWAIMVGSLASRGHRHRGKMEGRSMASTAPSPAETTDVATEAQRHVPSEILAESSYVPRTPLGARLMEIRKRIVASGQPLLDWDEIEREVSERRGGI